MVKSEALRAWCSGMWRHHLFQQSWRGIQHRVRQITISTTHAYTRIQIPDPTRTHRIWEASVLANTTAPQLPINFSNRPTNSPTAKRTTNRALMAIPDHTGRVSTYKGSLRRRSSLLKASRYCRKTQVRTLIFHYGHEPNKFRDFSRK